MIIDINIGKLYKLRNGLEVLIESEEGVCSPMPWDFTGRETTFKNYIHFRTNGCAHEGEEYDIVSPTILTSKE